MKLPSIFTLGRTSNKKAESERLMMEAQEALLVVILDNLPSDMGVPAPHFRDALNDSILQLTTETADKTVLFIQEQVPTHKDVAALVVDVLNRRDSDAAMNRIIDNFDYFNSLGWTFVKPLAGMVLGSFPSNLIHQDLSTEQQHALIRLHDAQWETRFTPAGGTKSQVWRPKCKSLAELVVERPGDAERIISLAVERNLSTVGEYMVLLDAAGAPSLSAGAL